jgi:hypothetical protein
VGLVLAVLSFGGGSRDSTDQDPVVLAGAADAALLAALRPPAIATTTTLGPNRAVLPENQDEFCTLADEYRDARKSAQLPGNRQVEWETQLLFLSVAASLVSPEAVEQLSGETWRSILLDLSDRQTAMNYALTQVNWDLGAYHDATSSGVVEAPPSHLFSVCG